MLKVVNSNNVLELEEIQTMAIEKIENGLKELCSYSGTNEFKKILGILKEKEKSDKKDESVKEKTSSKMSDNIITTIALGIAPSIAEQLKQLCKQSYILSYKILTGGSFSHCIAYVTHKFNNANDEKRNKEYSMSDIEAYKHAVQFYCAEGDISFSVNINLPQLNLEPITKAQVETANTAYKESLEKAVVEQAEIDRKKAEEKEKREKEKKEREAKEAKRKERERLKAEREKFKKAQQSFLPDEPSENVKKTERKVKSTKTEDKTSLPTLNEEVEQGTQLTLTLV